MQDFVEGTRFELIRHGVLPSGRSTRGIDEEPLWVQVRQGLNRVDGFFDDTLVRIDESIENSRDRVSDRVTQKMSELTTRELLHIDDEAVGNLHQQLCSSLESPCFPA